MDNFEDAVTARPASAEGRGFSSRAPVSETIEEGDTDGNVKNDADSFTDGAPSGRSMGKVADERIAAAETARAERKAAAQAALGEEAPDEEDPPEGEEPVVVVEPVAAAPAVPDEHRVRADRLEAANRSLVEELDAYRKRPAPAPKHLHDDAEDLYLEDSMGSLRRYVARSLGIEKIDDPKVDQELRDLYADWTSLEIGVTPDPAHQAKREAARTRQLWDREKRQRTADEQKKANEGSADADTQKATAAAEFISPRLAQKAGDYPLLTKLAETFDGMKPEMLLWKVIERESKTGRLVLTADDDANIAAAAKLVEDDYAKIRERIIAAIPPPTQITPPSTAKPSAPAPAAAPSASKEARQSHGSRTLTAADASVAPATPPAKKPPNDTPPKKFKSNAERQEWALRHLDK